MLEKVYTVSNPTLYVVWLKVSAIVADKCYVNENPQYIIAMSDSVNKRSNLRGEPLAQQPKINTTYSGLNIFTCQAAQIGKSLPARFKEASSLSDFKQHILKSPGADCQCGCCVYVVHMMFDLCILTLFYFFKLFYFFYKCILSMTDELSHIFSTSNVYLIFLIQLSPVSYLSINFHSVA